MIAAFLLLPSGAEAAEAKGVDFFGFLLLSGSLVAILVPLIQGQDEGWPLWTYLSIAGGVVLLVLFALWEVWVVKRGKTPLVPPHLFSHLQFTGGAILALVYFAAFTSIFFTISIFWQAGLGHSALESGLVSIPFALGSIVGASQSNRLSQRLGRTVLVIGTGMVALGLIALWLVLLLVPAPDLTNWDLLGPLLVAGVGSGLFIAPNAQFIVATVDRTEAGAASGVIGTMQRIGSAIGIAVIGSVFFGMLVLPTDRQPTPDDLANAFGTSATLGARGECGLRDRRVRARVRAAEAGQPRLRVLAGVAIGGGVAGGALVESLEQPVRPRLDEESEDAADGRGRQDDGERDREQDRGDHPGQLGVVGEEAGLPQRVEHEAVQQVDVHGACAEHRDPGVSTRDQREERGREHGGEQQEAQPQRGPPTRWARRGRGRSRRRGASRAGRTR